MPLKSLKRTKDSQPEELLCKHCSKVLIKTSSLFSFLWSTGIESKFLFQLRKSNQYCGICKRIWHPSDDGDWVRISVTMFGEILTWVRNYNIYIADLIWCIRFVVMGVTYGYMLNATTLRMNALRCRYTSPCILSFDFKYWRLLSNDCSNLVSS
jgi:hypothetical protein